MEVGIVGLPNVGKSTLFNALTNSTSAQAANYPFCTIEPNEGIVPVPDDRLRRISALITPKGMGSRPPSVSCAHLPLPPNNEANLPAAHSNRIDKSTA